jgi:hypothetical protein
VGRFSRHFRCSADLQFASSAAQKLDRTRKKNTRKPVQQPNARFVATLIKEQETRIRAEADPIEIQ